MDPVGGIGVFELGCTLEHGEREFSKPDPVFSTRAESGGGSGIFLVCPEVRMVKAAIYARMSTDKQSAHSPGDQIARCREFAKQRGWRVVEDLVVEDAGVSGASRHNRPKLLELIARIEEWDRLLCFDFSRLSLNFYSMFFVFGLILIPIYFYLLNFL